MDKRANKFFESWVSRHLKPTPMPEHFAEAERLANTCVADAKEAGISEAEIEQELAQDIVSALRERLAVCAHKAIMESANEMD